MTQPSDDPSSDPANSEEPRPFRAHARRSNSKAILFGALLGLLTGVIVLAITLQRGGDSLPRMTEADFNNAMARWDKNGPASYDLDLRVGGRRAGNVHLEVRDGEVTRMTRDGIEPAQRRTWDYWTVP